MHKFSVNRSKLKIPRNAHGSFLVEAIIAILVASIFGAALMLMYVQVRRVSNMTQGELYAIAVGQECVDQVRTLNYAYVANNLGVHYGSLHSNTNDALFPRPLMNDPNLDYTANGNQFVSKGSFYTFHSMNPDTNQRDDSVKIELQPGAIANSINVIVTINYLDTSGSVKSWTTRSLITQLGLNS